MKVRNLLAGALAASLLMTAAGAYGADGSWLKNVPAQERERANPYQGQADAVAAGQRLYTSYCSRCHGAAAEGTKKRPPLKSQRVQQRATEGDLHWLLVNGNRGKGMPSWSRLPDQQLWQLITFVKSLHD